MNSHAWLCMRTSIVPSSRGIIQPGRRPKAQDAASTMLTAKERRHVESDPPCNGLAAEVQPATLPRAIGPPPPLNYPAIASHLMPGKLSHRQRHFKNELFSLRFLLESYLGNNKKKKKKKYNYSPVPAQPGGGQLDKGRGRGGTITKY